MTSTDRSPLQVLYAEIGERVLSISAQRPSWPCHKGCDHCCRRLAEPLRLTSEEWARVERGLSSLEPSARTKVERRLRDLADGSGDARICPFLDRSAGACRIYTDRPAACRMYGFYVSRDGGRYCGLIEDTLERDGDDGILWGHHDALDERLVRDFGEPIPMATWVNSRSIGDTG